MLGKIPFNTLVLKVFNAQKNQIRPRMASIGLSPGQPKVLTFLALRGKVSQRELAEACDIEAATVSRLLGSLEEAQLISRTATAGDKRAVTVALTDSGQTLYAEEVMPRFEAVNKISLAGFSPEEQAEFAGFLRRMYRNLTGQEE